MTPAPEYSNTLSGLAGFFSVIQNTASLIFTFLPLSVLKYTFILLSTFEENITTSAITTTPAAYI